jgi:hypothetical protein
LACGHRAGTPPPKRRTARSRRSEKWRPTGLKDRKRNPAIGENTIKDNEWQLTRYLLPFFGELRPSEITKLKIKPYRKRVYVENEQIRNAAEAGKPLRDPRTGQRLRTLANDSINKTIGYPCSKPQTTSNAWWKRRSPREG